MSLRRGKESSPDLDGSSAPLLPLSPLPAKVKRDKNEDSVESDRLRALQRERDPFLETAVPAGATLHSLSLRYNVPVAEIKRVNNILRESEFHALKTVKIPVRPLSVLSEMVQPTLHGGGGGEKEKDGSWRVEHYNSTPMASSSAPSSPPMSEESGLDGGSAAVGNGGAVPKSKTFRKARKMFKTMDKDLAAIRQKNASLQSTVISSQYKDDDEDDDDDGAGDDEDVDLLLPAEHSVRRSSSGPVTPRWVCYACLAVIVTAVLLILLFANHEYWEIEHEAEHSLNETGRHKGGLDGRKGA